MNAQDQLNAYLKAIESRLRWMTLSRGAALTAFSALVATVVLVVAINSLAFSPASLAVARVLLFLALALALAFGLVLPLIGHNRKNSALRAEARFPEFGDRLITLAERQENAGPFGELLAGDAIQIARKTDTHRLAPTPRIVGLLSSAGIGIAVLIWLGLAGPSYLGYGTSLLWAGPPRNGPERFYDLKVSPGDQTVRRKSDQLITAQPLGFSPAKVLLYARSRGASKWEAVPMQPQPGANAFEFVFAALPDTTDYYVQAGAVRSKTYTLKTLDLPAVNKIRVTYHYPSWSGMQPVTEDPGGDLRAVEGTQAELLIETDRPLPEGSIVLDTGAKIALERTGNNRLSVRVPIDHDGMYHIAAPDQGETVRLSEDYFIEAQKYTPPTVKVTKPGRDARVSPIEEVTINVEADDAFGLQEVAVHYSVNGASEKKLNVLPAKGVKHASGKTVLRLEDFKLKPGDVVSLYATARDARGATWTDVSFIEAQPYEREYSQTQQQGGGGGQQEEENRISDRQKEIIAATWNELREKKRVAEAAEDGKFLSGTQNKLSEQAKTLAERMRARNLSGANPEFKSFAEDMDKASAEMNSATEKLKSVKWQDALGPEQRALQHILRAEATFRQIQVAFGSQNGGGGQGSIGRDLENLFDLELDTEKNQYETGRQNASGEQRKKEIDEALQKLEQLARRQKELAQQQKQAQQAFRQRWEQEMLHREAEELKRQMEQLARNQGSQSQSSSQQSSSSSSSSSGQQSRQQQRAGGGQASNDPRLEQALERIAQAAEDMRRAAQPQSEQGNAGQRRAAERLSEARDMLNAAARERSSQDIDDMTRKAGELAERQHEIADRLRQAYGGGQNGQQPGQTQAQTERMAAEKEKLASELKKLEQQMTGAARSLTGTKPSTATKLRDALSEMQQNDLEPRMRKTAEWLRRGQGSYTWMREATLTAGLDGLQERMKEVQQTARNEDAQSGANSAKSGKPGQGGRSKETEELEKALAQVEQMREQMQRAAGGKPGTQEAARGSRNGQGRQPGSPQTAGEPGQNGENAQNRSQQPNGRAQDGGEQQGAREGSQPSDAGARSGGERLPGSVGPGANGGLRNGSRIPEQTLREAARDLGQLRQQLQGEGPLAGQVRGLLRQIQRINLGQASDRELADRLNRNLLPEMERLELELRRKLDEQRSGQVRAAGEEPIPPGYANSVAEYFRKLSKSK